jgi:N,N'-diacetyllegionaminate synthase
LVTPLNIAGRLVGPGHSCFIIAEAGVNHNGSLERALALVDAAAAAGTDAVKFQTFRAEEIASAAAPKAAYQKQTTGPKQSQLDMLKALELKPEHHQALNQRCREKGILFLSTPFDSTSLDFLVGMGMAALKVPSGEITNLPFLNQVGKIKLPVILSTGMSTIAEVALAVDTLQQAGCASLALLHCVSNYPADPADANLKAMVTMTQRFGLPVGYSDHTMGPEVALAAVALGAYIIEKHFTLDLSLPGPDHMASAEPEELSALVAGIRKVESALGHGRKEPAPSEADTKAAARRSLVAARDILAGEVLSIDAVSFKRPGTGLGPERWQEVLGRKAKRQISAGTLISLEMLS